MCTAVRREEPARSSLFEHQRLALERIEGALDAIEERSGGSTNVAIVRE